MQTERQRATTRPSSTETHPSSTPSEDDAHIRATRLAQNADVLIDRILSEDSRAFLDSNLQTGGE